VDGGQTVKDIRVKGGRNDGVGVSTPESTVA